MGPLAEHNIRTTFASNLLASGGIEAVNPGTIDSAGVAAAVAQAGSPGAVVLCGTDKRYADEAANSLTVSLSRQTLINDVGLIMTMVLAA